MDLMIESVAVPPEPIDICTNTVTRLFDLELKTLEKARTERSVDGFSPSFSFLSPLIKLLLVEIVSFVPIRLSVIPIVTFW